MVKSIILSIKTFQVTLLAIFSVIGFLPIQDAHGYLIQEGAKDMEEVTAIAQGVLRQLKQGKFQNLIFCYCRTGQLEPHKKAYWVLGAPYWDNQEKAEALFNFRVSMRDEFGCLDTPVIIDLRDGDSIKKLPCYQLLSSEQQGRVIFAQAKHLKENARSADDLKEALRGYEEAQESFKAAGADLDIAATLNGRGSIYKSLDQHAKALEHYEGALIILRKIGEEYPEATMLNNIGLVYRLLGQYQKSLKYYEESLAIFKKIGDTNGERATLSNLEKIKRLIDEKGSDVKAESNDGGTVLTAATNADVVNIPLDKGADINAKNNNGTSLVKASNINPNLIEAATEGKFEEVKRLLNEGADVNARSNDGWTALIWASERGHVDVVKLLLDRGGAVKTKTYDGDTALTWASVKGRFEVVNLLLDKGADVNAKTDKGMTPLMAACQEGHLEIIKLFLNKGSDFNAKDNQGGTALLFAARQGRLEVLKLLLDRGADVNARDNHGGTALIEASAEGHLEMVKILLDRGAVINAKTDNGDTALIWASWKGHLEVVKLLLDKGADVNARTDKGGTALLRASAKNHLEVAKTLKAYGAIETLPEQTKVDVSDNRDDKPLPSTPPGGGDTPKNLITEVAKEEAISTKTEKHLDKNQPRDVTAPNTLSKMSTLFILLSLASTACLIIGLIKPTMFSRFFRGEITRNKIGSIFGIAIVVSFVLFAFTNVTSKMPLLFFLLFFASIVCLIIGLIKPTIFSRFMSREITRNKIAKTFGIATVVSFILFVITLPHMTKEKTDSTKKEKQIAKNLPTTDNTSNQVTQGNPSQKPATEIKPSEERKTPSKNDQRVSADETRKTGLKYYTGDGVKQDYQEALKWFRKAADQGDARAQYNIGLMYDNGIGVALNHIEALIWYQKAADQGDTDAQAAIKNSSDETGQLTKVTKETTDSTKEDNQPWETRGAGFFSDGYEFKDGVARFTVTLGSYDSLRSAGYTILEKLYEMANDKSVNRIEVSCIMNASHFSDRYGNTPEGDFVKNGNPMWSMGDFAVNQQRIDQIRKYKTVGNFTYDEINKIWIEYIIKALKHSQHLEK